MRANTTKKNESNKNNLNKGLVNEYSCGTL